uniref:Interleukin 1 receptor like 1 n=1 Tax=Salvator merianae TaxID=96440 RepID=A0A8D0BC39_SALMN
CNFIFHSLLLLCANNRILVRSLCKALSVKCPSSHRFETVSWHFGDKNISTDEGERIHTCGKNLWFLPASLNDSGNYTLNLYLLFFLSSSFQHIFLGSGKLYCPNYNLYKNASNIKWYKVSII